VASREAERELDRYAQVASLDRLALTAALLAWASLDTSMLQASFIGQVLPELLTTLTVAQAQAASIAADYVEESLVAQGAPPMGKIIIPQAFAGVAANGGELPGLLAQPLVRTLVGMSVGMSAPKAMSAGANLLDSIITTEIHDAARAAEFTAIAANAEAAGYIRMVVAGACSRCIVLAGRFYKWHADFNRHPKCRCYQVPAMAHTEPQSSQEIFDAMTAKEQDRTFTNAGAEAIRQGADIAQVVNVRMGMTTATVAGQRVATTTVGTTKGSYFSTVRRAIDAQRQTPTGYTTRNLGKVGAVKNYTQRKIARPRLMPEEILRQAKRLPGEASQRAEARRLLISNGYIVGDINALATEAIALTPGA
jgi:hypothetical protein